MSSIIKVENLGKKYRIKHQADRPRYTALRDVIAQKMKAPFHFLRRSQNSEVRIPTSALRSPTSAPPPISDLRPPTSGTEDFWALKDVSFEVKQGEVVGIIGRNGAGKSTLLKILSRITEPTTGRVEIDGRVASLLEVGTGFHPELTGRENVFLNGAILGMSRGEIRKKFDEIVAFAEVEKFLDTPVKRYSSGMYVRLAFAVAAHLEPEILIVDEVLAVGDAQFQKKCLGKMQDVAKGGRTVLFVSHQLDSIRSLCNKAIQLHSGRIEARGDVGDVISGYLRAGRATSTFHQEDDPTKQLQIIGAAVEENDAMNHRIVVQVTIKARTRKICSLDVRLTDGFGGAVGYGSFGTLRADESLQLKQGINRFRFAIDISRLAEGTFLLSFDLTHPYVEYFDRVERCIEFNISESHHDGNARALLQTWGYGSTELNLVRLCETEAMSSNPPAASRVPPHAATT